MNQKLPRWARASTVGLSALSLVACVPITARDGRPEVKPIGAYATEKSFAGSAAWPAEPWWTVYGDRQLDTLIDEALKGAPSLAVAEARLQRALAYTRVAGAPLRPQVSANGSATQQKQSYNYITPRAMTPQGWNDYGRATVDLSWELDFWGKNRAALAA
jgi:outer membrane protein TolC